MYKRHPCRHFEQLSGKPIGTCGQGGNCRFIHPDDPNWRGIRKDHPCIPRAPLASQPYAFRRRQQEPSSSPGRHIGGHHLGLAKEITRPSKPGNRDPQMNLHREEASRSEQKRPAISRRNVQEKGAAKENVNVEKIHVDNREMLQVPKEKEAEIVKKDRYTKHQDLNQKSSGEVWNAFLQIARLARESDTLGEQQKKEESKIVTYTAVEKTLNEISNEMGLAAIPQIDQSTLIQRDCRKTIGENNETVNRLCKEVVQVFVADVTNAVDKHLQTALQNIRNEADYVSKEIRKRNSQSAGVGSGWERRAQAGSSWSSQDFDKGVYRTKKRRMRTPSPYSRRSASKEGPSMSSETMKELEAKIERQAQALIHLAQENEKLRTQNQSLSTNLPAP